MKGNFLEFGTAKAEPGEKGTGYIKVGELSDGSPVKMPVIILNGKKPGPNMIRVLWATLNVYKSPELSRHRALACP